MVRDVRALAALSLTLAAALCSSSPLRAQAPPAFQVEEASIAGIHAAFRTGRMTCRGLVERYLRRIDLYDKNGPAVNALVLVNPRALAEADALDTRAAARGRAIPNYSTGLRRDALRGKRFGALQDRKLAGVVVVDPATVEGLDAISLLAYAYEQLTRHRRPPPTTPPVR